MSATRMLKIIHEEVWNLLLPETQGAVKRVANIHMLYTPPVSNNTMLAGDDKLKSDLPELAFITNLSRTAPPATYGIRLGSLWFRTYH